MNALELSVVGDKLAVLNDDISYVSGSKGYYTAEFTFDSDWDGLIPHITITENGTERADEVIVNNTHNIATTESGIMQIGVYGLDSEGNKCISCNCITIEVKQGAYTGVTPMPKDIWDGYQIVVLGYAERAESATADAKSSADNAAQSEENAKASEDAAEAAKETAVNAAARAEAADTNATTAQEAAEKSARDAEASSIIATQEATKAYQRAESIKNMQVKAVHGEEAGVEKSESEDGIKLSFTLPRGETGDKGEKGDTGDKGADGYTPIRGTDYWTEKDKAEIKAYVNEAILGGEW